MNKAALRSQLPLGAALIVVGIAGGVAFSERPWDRQSVAVEQPSTLTPAVVRVEERTISVKRNVVVTAKSRTGSMPVTVPAGTITRLSGFDTPDPVVWINEVPVFAAVGQVPMYRPLQRGVSGTDVAQLQEFLVSRQLLGSEQVDGTFGSATSRAVGDLYSAYGVRMNSIPMSGILFLPQTLDLYSWPSAFRVGGQAGGPIDIVTADVRGPEFSFLIAADGSAAVGDAVEILGLSTTAIVASLRESDQGLEAVLLSSDDGPLCPHECSLMSDVPTADSTSLRATHVLVAPQTGPSLPLGALGLAADGLLEVLLATGERATVEVIAVDGSFALVTGLDVGDEVILGVDDGD